MLCISIASFFFSQTDTEAKLTFHSFSRPCLGAAETVRNDCRRSPGPALLSS